MKLEWLEVLEFRHVTPGARMEFADGVNVIMGRNGTGKTNLLKLLGALTRWDVSALEKERFHVKYGAKAGELRLEVELKNVPPRPRFRVGMMEGMVEGMVEETDDEWFAKFFAWAPNEKDIAIEFSHAESKFVRNKNEHYEMFTLRGIPQAVDLATSLLNMVQFRFVDGVTDFSAEWTNASYALFRCNGRGRIDEGLEQFNAFISGSPGDGMSPLGFNLKFAWLGNNYVPVHPSEAPTALVRWLAKTPKEMDVFDADLAEIVPELLPTAEILGLAKLRFLIRRTDRSVDGDNFDTMKGITFKAILPNGSEFDQDKLSFGQKRMLTFLWYAAANEHGPIIVDELANGLHHAWIAKCFEVIGERQAFLSTQNPLILDFLDFTSAEHTARSIVRCEVSERGWRWGNLNAEEADRLYRACQANFMHVSEILRSEGLW